MITQEFVLFIQQRQVSNLSSFNYIKPYKITTLICEMCIHVLKVTIIQTVTRMNEQTLFKF